MTLRVHPDEIVRTSTASLLAIHQSWERVRLGDIADVLNGFAFKSQFFGDDGVPLLRIRDVGKSDTGTMYSGAYDKVYLVQPGEVVVGMDGDFRVALWPGRPALLNQRVCKVTVRDAELYEPHFLLYALPGYLDAVNAHTSSITVKHLSSRTVQDISLPLPPLNEQRRIVAAIEEHLSRLDAADASLDAAQLRVKVVRTSALDDVSAEAIARWGLRPVMDVCSAVTNGNTPPAHTMSANHGEVPFIKVYNLTMVGSLDFSKKPTFIDRETHEQRLRKSRLKPGDVLINIVGPPLGKVAVVPPTYPEWNTNQAVVAFRPRTEQLSTDLLAYWLQSKRVLGPLLATAKATAGQFNLSISACRRLEVPVPPMEEQRRIVAEVEERLSAIDALRAAIERAQRRSAALRRSVLERAFRGELVPQDSSDEPAEALLARIRADREARPVSSGHRRKSE